MSAPMSGPAITFIKCVVPVQCDIQLWSHMHQSEFIVHCQSELNEGSSGFLNLGFTSRKHMPWEHAVDLQPLKESHW